MSRDECKSTLREETLKKCSVKNLEDSIQSKLLPYDLKISSMNTELQRLNKELQNVESQNDEYVVETDNNIDGDLYYRGKNIFGGYSKSFKDLDKFTFLNELETGDIGYKNLRGNFFITGRKKEIIKYRDETVFPIDIEGILQKSFKYVNFFCF